MTNYGCINKKTILRILNKQAENGFNQYSIPTPALSGSGQAVGIYSPLSRYISSRIH
ncbi:hypothetical protein MTBBW1_10002 [Desulfamplus magnetovallimortis]|uniref:Uncharacterized protein n=1 Tax=Desulfamplus magnetovallimortis TaxID=1246637 RepID=A0A1W1H4D5_9BACT|nr:hypothetical protein MTBBW1_10002 [Desulfamplus magnetovallimortis]